MKRSMFILAIVLLAIIVGCQENNVNGPSATPMLETNPVPKAAPSNNSDIINPHPSGPKPSSDGQLFNDVPGNIGLPIPTLPLNAILLEPGHLYNSFVEIIGTVAFHATVVPLDPAPPNPQYAVRLNLIADAEVTPYRPGGPQMLPVWHVSGTSDDGVPVPESGTAFLTKRYQIEGRDDGMLLNLKFQVTLASVELNSMWLELPRTGHLADND